MRAHRTGAIERLAAIAFSVAVWSNPGLAAETIVGTWGPVGAACTPADGMISIGPLSLAADELSCQFRDVARSGDMVTWHGRCSNGAEGYPATVVAKLRGGKLAFTLNGGRNGPYRRCRSN